MQEFWRVDCSFIYKGQVRVENRIHFELAESEDEAGQKTKDYLESWPDYSDVVINEAHRETESEKYERQSTEPVKRKLVVEKQIDDGELF